MRNGKGVYHFGEKNKLDGMWKNNLPHGEGVITYDDKKIEGEFRYGKLVKGQNGQDEISSPKKKRKGRKSQDDGKHKSHKHRHSHDKSSKKVNKRKHSEGDKNKIEMKDKENGSNDDKDKQLPEIDGIPGICVKKMK